MKKIKLKLATIFCFTAYTIIFVISCIGKLIALPFMLIAKGIIGNNNIVILDKYYRFLQKVNNV